MKTKCILLVAMMMVSSSLCAQKSSFNFTPVDPDEVGKSRDLPLYTTVPIYEAPDGVEHANQLRESFFYYFENGYVNNTYKDGMIGDYVMAEDGNIYLKQPFVSLNLFTYLMLEPVDDTIFVAHTPQCVYSENNEYMYATRLVYTQLSENSYTYMPEEISGESYNTDMYFIYKDGVLRQQDDTMVTANGEDFPHELLGATNANGGWMGIGDGTMVISPVNETPAELPSGVASTQVTMLYDVLNTILEAGVDHPAISEYAEDGNDIYLKIPYKYSNGGYWAKGTANSSGTISFEKQYLGIDEEHDRHLWLMPATYRDTVIIWDDDYHECYRIYDEVNEIVFNRNGEYIESETPYSMLINSSSTQQDIASSLSDPRTSIYEVGPATPIMPYFTGVCEFVDDWFGYFIFNTPNISTEGSYIEPDSMYYNVFINGNEDEPYVFTPENYWALTEPIVDVPYSFDDDQDIIFLGFSHEIFFYWPWESIGIRSIYKYNGEVHYSDIKWHNHFPSGVDEIITEDGGDVVATEYYDLMGRKVAKPENGVYIKVSIMDNGARRGEKVLIKK